MSTSSISRTVLICNEGEPYLDMELRLLARAGYEPRVVPSERLKLEIIRRRAALVVLGLEHAERQRRLLRGLRGDARSRSVGLVVTAGEDAIPAASLPRGANRMLRKPFSAEEFLQSVEELANVSPRRPACVDLYVKTGDGELLRGSTRNLSESGLLLECEGELHAEEECMVFLILPGRVIPLPAIVVRTAEEQGSGYFGLRFRGAREDVRALLGALGLAPAKAREARPRPTREARISIIEVLGDNPVAIRVEPDAFDRWLAIDVPLRLVAVLDGTRTAREVVRDSGVERGEVERWLERLLELDCLE